MIIALFEVYVTSIFTRKIRVTSLILFYGYILFVAIAFNGAISNEMSSIDLKQHACIEKHWFVTLNCFPALFSVLSNNVFHNLWITTALHIFCVCFFLWERTEQYMPRVVKNMAHVTKLIACILVINFAQSNLDLRSYFVKIGLLDGTNIDEFIGQAVKQIV